MASLSNRNSFSVAEQQVLVVGGTRGIGRAISQRFASEGARVLASYVRNEQAARDLDEEAVTQGWALQTVRGDASSDVGRQRIESAVDQFIPGPTTFVYAAATGVHRPAQELTGRHFDFTFGLNVRAFLLLVQSLARRMSAGSIIALSSEGAVHAIPHYSLVGSSKAALESLCRHLAVELAPSGIRVNVLSPGLVRTEAWDALPGADERIASATAGSPRGCLTSPEEVAAAAQFLASGASSGVTGHTLVVDGGGRIVGTG